jgi:hypothetical protein
MPSRKEEIAWAAGLFEGEGCVTETDGRFTMRLNNTDERVVRRFDEIVVWGLVYGPYRQLRNRDGRRRKPFWVWVAQDYNAYDAFNLLAPWLSERRLQRAYELTGVRFPVFFGPARTRLVEPNPALPDPPHATET